MEKSKLKHCKSADWLSKSSELCEGAVESSVYPGIYIVQNLNQQPITSYNLPSTHKPLHYTNPSIPIYLSCTKKLLKQTLPLTHKDIWVLAAPGAVGPIYLYFTEPHKYPVMECCYRPVYLEFSDWLSGSVKCSQCNKVGFSFVYVGSESKSPQKDNQKVYKEAKFSSQNKRANIRKLISSNQHRYKNLKKIVNKDLNKGLNTLLKRNNSVDCGRTTLQGNFCRQNFGDDNLQSDSQQLRESQSFAKLTLSRTGGWNKKQNLYSSVMTSTPSISGASGAMNFNDFQLGDFVIEIQDKNTRAQNQNQNASVDTFNRLSQYNSAKGSQTLSETCLQIKSIIEQIFSTG